MTTLQRAMLAALSFTLSAGCALWTQPLGGNRGAYRACVGYIEEQAGLRSSEAQPFEAGPEIRVLPSGDYEVRVLYPKTGAAWRCDVLEVVSGEWALVTLEPLR